MVEEKFKETLQLKGEVEEQLATSRKEVHGLESQIHDISLRLAEVVRIADAHEAELNGQQPTKTSEKIELRIKPQQKVDSKQILHDIEILRDWATEQKNELPMILKERAKILDLNLKLNSLVQENSLLSIMNEKYMKINL